MTRSVIEDPNIFSNARHCKGVKIYNGINIDGLNRSLARHLIGSEREQAIEEYKAGKYHGCVQEYQNCGMCLYRFTCKYIRYDKEEQKDV